MKANMPSDQKVVVQIDSNSQVIENDSYLCNALHTYWARID